MSGIAVLARHCRPGVDTSMVAAGAAAVAAAAIEPAISPWWALAPAVAVPVLRGRWRGGALAASVLFVAILVGGRAHDARLGLVAPEPGSFTGRVMLVADPEPVGSGVRAVVRIRSQRIEAWAVGPAAWRLESALAGERVDVEGTLGPLRARGPVRGWLASRHIAGRLTVREITAGPHPGSAPTRLANAVRRALVHGARSLDPSTRALYTGLVIGDDRYQSPSTIDDFRGAGLGHLLAVSGQNVAFVLVLAQPFLRRLGLVPRLLAAVTVLGFFALVTRFEPSVLRAVAVAGIAAGASTIGAPIGRLRLLAAAGILVLAIDPFLVRALGFQLSMAAASGIIILHRPLARSIRAPRPVAEAIAVTVAAQLGVAPLLFASFGSMPLAAVPANVAAAPASGPVMAWGLSVGLAAAVLPDQAAAVVQIPADLAVGWIRFVAHAGATARLGELDARGAAVLGVGIAAVALLWPRAAGTRRSGMRSVPPVAAGVVLAVVVAGRSPAPRGEAEGLSVWRHRSTVVVVEQVRPAADVFGALRRRGVDTIDLLVLTGASHAETDLARDIARRHTVRAVVVPDAVDLERAVVVEPPRALVLGDVVVTLTAGSRPRSLAAGFDEGSEGAG